MRVTPDRQTLILAGEMPPGRSVARAGSSSQRVTVFSARVDAVVTETEYTASADTAAYDAIDAIDASSAKYAALPAAAVRPSAASRGSAYGVASAYARTQDLSERQSIIDTYA